MGRGLVFRWSATPPPKGAASKRSPIFGGSFLFMCTPFVTELSNLTWGRRVCLGVSHACHSKRAEFQRSPMSRRSGGRVEPLASRSNAVWAVGRDRPPGCVYVWVRLTSQLVDVSRSDERSTPVMEYFVELLECSEGLLLGSSSCD